MRRNFARIATLSIGLAACSSANSGTESAGSGPAAARTGAAISEADLRHRMYLVADDSMGGRPTGSFGHIKVTEYLAAEAKRIGLLPGGDNGTYFQNVPFIKRVPQSITLSVDGQNLAMWDDFIAVHPGAAIRSYDNVQVVYGGVIQDTMTMLTREQAAGKFVILTTRGGGQLRGTTAGSRLEGAAGVATILPAQLMGLYRNFLRTPGPTFNGGEPVKGDRGVAMGITAEAAAKLMGSAIDSTTRVGALGKTIRGSASWREEPLVARNVVAILPGSDAKLKGTYVAIGAHSDHVPFRLPPVDHDSLKNYNMQLRSKRLALGRNPTAAERAEIKVNVDSLRKIRPARLDSINNGADDDGSGTIGVLEIAEAMAAAPQKPKRSVLFIWHVAEELGLFGAQYFTDHPTVPRDSIVAGLNNDMIGRGGPGEEIGGGPDYVQLIGWRRLSNELGDIVDAVNKQQQRPFKFDLQYDATGHPEQYYCRSDHYMYARFGIPIAFFSTGNHGDYHQVTDEPAYIDYTKLKNVSQLVHDIGIRVANLDHRPVVDGVKQADPKGQCRQ